MSAPPASPAAIKVGTPVWVAARGLTGHVGLVSPWTGERAAEGACGCVQLRIDFAEVVDQDGGTLLPKACLNTCSCATWILDRAPVGPALYRGWSGTTQTGMA